MNYISIFIIWETLLIERYPYTYTLIRERYIQGVTGGKDQISGGCSLC